MYSLTLIVVIVLLIFHRNMQNCKQNVSACVNNKIKKIEKNNYTFMKLSILCQKYPISTKSFMILE